MHFKKDLKYIVGILAFFILFFIILNILHNKQSEVLFELTKSFFNLCVALTGLFLTWSLGQRIISHWDLQKKRTELDISLARQFQQLHGEFKEIWRLWKVHCTAKSHGLKHDTDENRYNLLARAAKAEGAIEAIILKIVTEHSLDKGNIHSLGLFRQCYQQLRQNIRDNRSMKFQHDDPQPRLFNELSCAISCIIISDDQRGFSSKEDIQKIYSTVMGYRTSDYDAEIARRLGNKIIQHNIL